MSLSPELKNRLTFLEEMEKLKTVQRTNKTLDGRQENSAEHSWHLAVMLLLLKDNFPGIEYDLFHTMQLLLLHDIVEIDAGDHNLYRRNSQELFIQEQQAARRIFGLLPKEQAEEMYRLWEEFEQGQTPEARVARVIDNLQPLINHPLTRREGEKVLDIKVSEIITRKSFIGQVSPELWEAALTYIRLGLDASLYINDTEEDSSFRK